MSIILVWGKMIYFLSNKNFKSLISPKKSGRLTLDFAVASEMLFQISVIVDGTEHIGCTRQSAYTRDLVRAVDAHCKLNIRSPNKS